MIAWIIDETHVEVDGRVLAAYEPEWVDGQDGVQVLHFLRPAENGTTIVVMVEAGDGGVALVGVSIGRSPGVEGIDAAVRRGTIVPVLFMAPETIGERMEVLMHGPYVGRFDDVDALVDEIEFLSTMPVDPAHPVSTVGQVS